MAKRSDRTRKRKGIRILNGQVIAAVYAHRDASLEQGFPEIISVRIIRPPGMIQRSTEMDFFARNQRGLLFISIKSPVKPAG